MRTEEKSTTADPVAWDDIPAETQRELLALADESRQGATEAVDEQGRKWTFEDLLGLGLTRREALAVLGAIASGAVFSQAIREAIQPAAASHGNGEIGVAGDPIDTAHVTNIRGDGDPVSIDELSNASFNDRPEWSTGAVSITVGTDTGTLQEAVDLIPRVPYHKVEIDIPSGFDASTEDVVISQTHLGKGSIDTRGYEHKVSIVGDTATPSNCPVGSLVAVGVLGGVVSIDGVEFQQNNPHDDESAPVVVYNSDHIRLKDCAFAGGTNGVKAYGAAGNLSLYGVDFGSNVLSGNAIGAKHGGRIRATAGTPSIEGNVGGYVFTARSGTIEYDSSVSSLTGDSGLIDPTNSRNGYVTDKNQDSGVVTNFRGMYQFEEVKQDNTLTLVQATANQTISSASMTKMAFDTAAETESATFDDTNDEVEVATAGRYRIYGMAKWTTDTGWSTGDRCSLRIVLNHGQTDESFPADPVQRKAGTEDQAVQVLATRNLSAGDAVGIQIYQDSGASKSLSGSAVNNFLEVVRVG